MTKTLVPRLNALYALLAGSLVVGCGSTPPPPVISQINPSALCDQSSRSFQIQGTGFLKNDMLPQVTFTSTTNPATTVTVTATDASGCTDQQCTTLSVTVDNSQLPDGSYGVVIKNNCQDATCTSTQSGPPAQVDVVAPPTLTAVAPPVICQGQGTLTLTGSKFYSGGSVTIGSATSMSLQVSADGTSATATFAGMLPLSPVDPQTQQTTPLDVSVTNAPGCAATLAKAVTITPGPSILFVDPPAVPAKYSIQATVYAASVAAPIQDVLIAPSGSGNFTSLKASIVADPAHPNRVLVTLPGNLSAGSYDVKLDDQTSCAATLPSAFKVVATASLTVNAPTPSFGALSANTAVSITGTGFVSTPRAYAAINGGSNGVAASALRAVTFGSATALTAVVPSTLTAGTYDLVVVNPDGSFGIKASAFTVTQATQPPPVIGSIAPSSVVVATSAPITINGNNFRTPSLSATCYDGTNTAVAGATAAVVSSTTTAISATLNAPTGSFYCIVRVTDGDNNTFVDYSAVGVTNAGLNLNGFKAGTNLGTARRALGAAAGRPTQVARFVYAVGGDNGTDNAPIKTVEAAPTGLDGTLGAFMTLSQPLPKALSFLGVVNLGRFLYAVGGFDGTAASNGVYRAEILDPLNAPQFSDVDVRPSAQGVMPGLYTYRISAVMANADANNPGGETLASDFFPVQIPMVSMGSVQLVLYWKQVPGAQSYRIYRTINANAAAGTEHLLATVTDNAMATQSYVDTGATAPAGATPLPLGSTGAWKTLPTLATARAGAAVVVAPDPTTANTYYLYAMGGNSGTPSTVTLQSSVEFLKITLANGGALQNTDTSWTASAQALPTARWLTPGLYATNAQNSVIAANQTFIYAATGLSTNLATGTTDKPVYVSAIATGGQPGAFANSGSVGVGGAGFGPALVNNQMYAFGGIRAGAPSTASDSAKLSAGNSLGNFNALGSGTLTTVRALQGTAIESAFIYQLGGVGAASAALGTTEQTIW